MVQRLPRAASCGWCASTPTTGACRAWNGPAAWKRPTSSATAFRCWWLGEASLAELNQKLVAAGHGAVGIERFRPNIVLAGLEAQDEDRLDVLRIAAGSEEVQLRPVKPCPRCPIPNIDPATAQVDPQVSDMLADLSQAMTA